MADERGVLALSVIIAFIFICEIFWNMFQTIFLLFIVNKQHNPQQS